MESDGSSFTSQFMPHGHCYLWKPEIVWLHVISDAIIVLSYYMIPFLLAYVVFRTKIQIRYGWLVSLFAIFIVACGTTHLMEIVNVWQTNYVLAGLIKAITALASILTAISMISVLPQLIRFLIKEKD